jgi:hypothetical protein
MIVVIKIDESEFICGRCDTATDAYAVGGLAR